MRYKLPSKATLIATLAFSTVAALMFTLSKPVELRVDGQPVISDVAPVATAREVYVPLRPVSEALGAQTKYVHKTGDIVVTRGDESVHLRVGSVKVRVNGMPLTLQHAPFRVRGRVMVSLHAVQQVFGVHVHFDKETARVEVNTPGVSSAAELETQ
jgi:hypothetical protein